MKHLLLGLALLSGAAGAQTLTVDPRAAQIAAMERLSWLVGEWEGRATFQRPDGTAEVLSWERVTRAAGGTALLVQGRHYERQADGARGRVVHDAAGLITYDTATRRYRVHSQLAEGRFGMFPGAMQGDSFVWDIELPQGLARHRVMRDAQGRWVERGEFCPASDRPDTPCRGFLDMTLSKVPGKE